MLRDDQGTATIWVAGAVAALAAVLAALLAFGAAIVSRHQAGAAADLAALAAAGHAERGAEAACGQARLVTEEMAVRLTACRLEQWDALVEVTAEGPAGFGPAMARARAGPVQRRTVSGDRTDHGG
ncbi:flp pilus-assembly TadE/G-like family protein [Amycolatopsis rhizosphaerae]|uniref:Flp pilus-assembly TadE/G-like family protein n=1 Tax=Amycolatopsis rhizosphaerae TaxID=2053003 RepID=A0A558B169_9PSEU|nr:Rv3654c family TadE-like protein [Amycolatopsis rhizosphaerae]TVT30268.1 flp pilus-assembly TadE/G-like family protein [Amycolatopsis rhizosphaerae]